MENLDTCLHFILFFDIKCLSNTTQGVCVHARYLGKRGKFFNNLYMLNFFWIIKSVL